MKISVLIPSCGRRSLGWVIGALHSLASGRHEIAYCVGLDDPCEAIHVADDCNVRMGIYGKLGSLGAIYNRLTAENPADIYCIFADDVFPLTVAWDAAIHAVHTQVPANILAWFDTAQPMLPTHPIIPHAWYKFAGDKIFTDYFPFWFDDTWLTEVYKMATGQDILIPKQLMLGGKKGGTNRMRDLAFWWHFFSRTRTIRMKIAKELQTKGKMTHDFSGMCQEVIRAGLDRDIAFRKKLPDMEAAGGDKGEPDAAYLATKSRAEQFLAENRLL